VSGEQDDISVICVKFSEKNMRLVPGNREGRCDVCRRRIVVSPQGRAIEPDPGFTKRYLCIRCAQAEEPDDTAGPVPGAPDEFVRQTGLTPAAASLVIGKMSRTKLKDFRPEDVDGE
jgi:DNA-directed RNA polymerase subunit RPC12/RpoP